MTLTTSVTQLRILLAGLLTVSVSSAVIAQVATVGKPTWRTGTIFNYEMVDLIKGEVIASEEHKVVSVNGDQVQLEVVSPKSGGKETRAVDLLSPAPAMSRWPCFLSPAAQGCKGVHEMMRFPAKVGDKWKYKQEFPSASVANAQATWDISAEIDDWEEVKVPAGTFRAMRIEHDGYWERPDSRGRVEVVYWYSPDIGRVVKQSTKIFSRVGWIDTREEVRLTRYVTPAADAPKPASSEDKKQ